MPFSWLANEALLVRCASLFPVAACIWPVFAMKYSHDSYDQFPVIIAIVFQLGESPLHVASGNGFEELVAFLLDQGCDAGVEDGRGDTPLMWAARNGGNNLYRN